MTNFFILESSILLAFPVWIVKETIRCQYFREIECLIIDAEKTEKFVRTSAWKSKAQKGLIIEVQVCANCVRLICMQK